MIKEILWLVFIYPIVKIKLFYLRKKSKKLCQQIRVYFYKQFPPIQGDIGIGYKNGRLYDYLYKENIT